MGNSFGPNGFSIGSSRHVSSSNHLRAISYEKRHDNDNETAEVHLKRREEVLPVSRNYLRLFRQT
jgi:hypothetical protein